MRESKEPGTDKAATVGFRVVTDPWPTRHDDVAVAAELVASMTTEEKLALVSVPMGYGPSAPPEALGSAAYCSGAPRVGVPPWDESDASLGVTNPMGVRGADDVATAFPSTLAVGATFSRELAAEQGRAVGAEAAIKGITVQLAGGMNLVREPRGGRNFEYISEDALHTGILAGAAVSGIQSQGVVATVKHFALNAQETGRVMVGSDLDEAAMRESDLLAFQIALEHGAPRAVMTAYNRVNRVYAAENPWLIRTVLKQDWGFPGFVMSDWGGTHSAEHAALAGLDRQSGHQLDTAHFFGEALAAAITDGRVPMSRLDDMVTRIVAALRSVGGLGERRRPGELDNAQQRKHRGVAEQVAAASIVLLRNKDDVLPLPADTPRIVVVGGRADVGVLSGGGSTTVTPPGAVSEPGISIAQITMPKVHHPPAPLDELRARMPGTEIVFVDADPGDVAEQVRPDDVVVVFAQRWGTEGRDLPDLSLDGDHDARICAVAARARRTVVVLEVPGPVAMPWLEQVDAVLVAWYGGSGGAGAIAAVLSGEAAPSGRLPVTFPCDVDQLPRRAMTDPDSTTSNPGEPRHGFVTVDYDVEGADVGYRWYARESLTPLFWFGAGLSYTAFVHEDVTIELDADGYPVVTATVRNVGAREGVDVPQVYIAPPGSGFRLGGWARVSLVPGGAQRVEIVLDEPRCYARFDVDDPGWTIEAGDYRVRLARSADPGDSVVETTVSLAEHRMRP
ncbi:glycoside hydrolase family 3 C-terminal domain-containing protein [Rhodococcus sp. NPDC058521]|uniref:glycoside hydrolase family 3 C-terminal domain-containing protein n=1 Tax=Rhodococcus sp. NPDC058521 TaxID=3346536 RepID=UPI0036647DFF